MDMPGWLILGLMLGTGHGHVRFTDTWADVRHWPSTC